MSLVGWLRDMFRADKKVVVVPPGMMRLDDVYQGFRPSVLHPVWDLEEQVLWRADHRRLYDMCQRFYWSREVGPVVLGDGVVLEGHHVLVMLRHMSFFGLVDGDFLVPIVFGEETPA